MFFIHDSSCISPQQSFSDLEIETVHDCKNNKLFAIEPAYTDIPSGVLRRMGKAVRLGVGAALPLLKKSRTSIAGIVIGTSNGGMEDCIKFLNQIIEYNEGMLTPTNFVQSTTNAVAGQIGLLAANTGYNATHVHRGLAFENALLDVDMLLGEDNSSEYLVGGVEEISAYNYNIELLGGWYKKELMSSHQLYESVTPGSIAGEGSAIFLVNNKQANAISAISGIRLLHNADRDTVKRELRSFLDKYLGVDQYPDLLLSGENGDVRLNEYYNAVEQMMNPSTGVARFKHMMGEYPTASAAALWLAVRMMQNPTPGHMVKRPRTTDGTIQHILIYNTYKGTQHGFILLQRSA